MANKFLGFLEAVGREFKKYLPIGEAAVSFLFPGIGGLFNVTANAIMTAEASAAAVGRQSGTGAQKSAAVIAIMGPLIKQALADAGKSGDDTAVQKYIDAVVLILNTTSALEAKASE